MKNIVLYHLDKGLAAILQYASVAQIKPRRHNSTSLVSARAIATALVTRFANPTPLPEAEGCFRACGIPSPPRDGTAALLLPSDVSCSL